MRKRVLVLDWGIGGLSVYREIKRLRPGLSCVYASDSGFTPYGKAPASELAARLAQVIERAVLQHDIESTVLACNAASTVLEEARRLSPLRPIRGMIEAGVELVRESGCQVVGVIGGQRTIESHVFSRALSGAALEIRERVAQPLSALIEAGELRGPQLEQELRAILGELGEIDALLLACTHYPAIAGEIQRLLPRTRLLDPAARAALQVSTALPPSPECREAGPSEDHFFTSGSPENSTRAARAAFGVPARFRRWEIGQ